MRLGEMKQPQLFIGFFVIGLFLAFFGIYYWMHQEESRDSALLGEKICGNLDSEEARDNCCVQILADTPHDVCTTDGTWHFNATLHQCSYICEPEPVFCTADAMMCPDNMTYVARNGSLNCAFNPCP